MVWVLAVGAVGAVVWLLVERAKRVPMAEWKAAVAQAQAAEAARVEAEALMRAGKERLAEVEARAQQAAQENSELRSELHEQQRRTDAAQETLRARQQALEDLRLQLKDSQEIFRQYVENTANRLLNEAGTRLNEQQQVKLGEMLTPLKETFKAFEKQVNETYDKESRERMSLETEVKRLAQLNQRVSEEANSLASALRGNSKMQGDWGEAQLLRLLEMAGMKEHTDFTTQSSHTDEEGNRLRPDVVILLPGNRRAVIDSKVSLRDYVAYTTEADETNKMVTLDRHVAAIKSHIQVLSAKKYDSLKDIDTAFTVMYIPIEPAYLSALQTDPSLMEYANARKVLLTTTSTLFGLLSLFRHVKQEEQIHRNALEIARVGGALYDKFVDFITDYSKAVDQAGRLWDALQNNRARLTGGRGNLVAATEKLRDLGAKAKKQLPLEVVELALEEEGDWPDEQVKLTEGS